MELVGWKPLDLIVGGMLTAGVAFGVYKLGSNRKGSLSTELDATSLQECIALAGRPSELEVSVLPQPDGVSRRLASRLKHTMRTKGSGNNVGRRDGVPAGQDHDDVSGRHDDANSSNRTSEDTAAETSSKVCRQLNFYSRDDSFSSPERSPPKRSRRLQRDAYCSPLLVDRTPPELTRQLQSYRDTLNKWTADSDAKMEKIEQQRMNLATELHVTRDALHAERRHRAEADQMRQKVEARAKELEKRLQKSLEEAEQLSKRESEVSKLEQQVEEMEEQLEGLYLHNVVTPRKAVQENVAQHTQLAHTLHQAQTDLQRQQQAMQDLENDIINLSAQLNKARKDARQLGEDNASLQTQLHRAHRAARDMVALLYERSAGSDAGREELTELLNAPDSETPLDQLLQCVTSLIAQS